MTTIKLKTALGAVALLLAACGGPEATETPLNPTIDQGARTATPEEEPSMTFQITSPAFDEGDSIPTPYTCDGENKSPPLHWSQVPQNAGSLALVMDDPDAPSGTFVHWVFYNLPPDVDMISEGAQPEDIEALGGENGTNSRGQTGHTGPCPPSGEHRYFFKLYALDTTVDLTAGATKSELEAALSGHVIEQAELMGVYSR